MVKNHRFSSYNDVTLDKESEDGAKNQGPRFTSGDRNVERESNLSPGLGLGKVIFLFYVGFPYFKSS